MRVPIVVKMILLCLLIVSLIPMVERNVGFQAMAADDLDDLAAQHQRLERAIVELRRRVENAVRGYEGLLTLYAARKMVAVVAGEAGEKASEKLQAECEEYTDIYRTYEFLGVQVNGLDGDHDSLTRAIEDLERPIDEGSRSATDMEKNQGKILEELEDVNLLKPVQNLLIKSEELLTKGNLARIVLLDNNLKNWNAQRLSDHMLVEKNQKIMIELLKQLPKVKEDVVENTKAIAGIQSDIVEIERLLEKITEVIRALN